MKTKLIALLLCLTAACNSFAGADLEVNTPGVNALKQSMQARHAQLAAYYESGAVGLTADGLIAVRDAASIPMSARQTVNTLVATENQDRNALYLEIANANGHPEWQADIRNTFAQRWVQRAQSGWWVQSGGGWQKK